MKLFSTEITTSGGEKIAKAVLLRKNRKGYSLLQHYITEPENLKSLSGNYPAYFCIDYFDTIIETLNVPPVKDSKTFKMLAANKLKDQIEEGVSPLMAYKVDKKAGKDRTGNLEYKVYVIPEKLFTENPAITAQQRLKMNLFTLSDIAVVGVSNFYFGPDTVFHAYADDYKVLITVSRGSSIIYSRTLEYEAVAGQALESVFYENINLTFMFVTKNLRVNVERMVFSGKLKNMTELSQMLFQFNGIPQSVIITHELVPDCSRDTFHEFMIPISLCMLEDSYDFTPEEFKERRGFNSLKRFTNLTTAAAVAVLLYMNVTAFSEYGFAKERLASQMNVIGMKLERYVRNFEDADDKKFGYYYLKQIEKGERSAFDMYPDVAGLLELGDFRNVTFKRDDKGLRVMISGKIETESFKNADTIRLRIESYLSQLSAGGKYKVSDTSKYDDERLTADIRIEISEAGR